MKQLRGQLSGALLAALEQDGTTQADLARHTGLSAKHINHLVNGKSGALAMYDYAALTLGRRWVVSLAPLSDDDEGTTDDRPGPDRDA